MCHHTHHTHLPRYAVMLATRSRPHSQHHQHRQQQHEVVHPCKRPAAGLLAVLVFFAALGSALAGGYPQHTNTIGTHSSRPTPCFLGLSFGEKKAPAVPEPLSLGDRARELGDRVRRGGVGGLLAGKESGSSATRSGKAEAMAAAQALTDSPQPPKDKSNGRNSFVAGGLAGSVSTTITCPIEVSLCGCFCRLSVGLSSIWCGLRLGGFLSCWSVQQNKS